MKNRKYKITRGLSDNDIIRIKVYLAVYGFFGAMYLTTELIKWVRPEPQPEVTTNQEFEKL